MPETRSRRALAVAVIAASGTLTSSLALGVEAVLQQNSICAVATHNQRVLRTLVRAALQAPLPPALRVVFEHEVQVDLAKRPC